MTNASTSPNLGLLSDEEKRTLLISLLQQSRRTPVLSVTQERIWQLSQINPGNPVYNFQSALAVTGPLEHAALAQAHDWVVSRHEPLRTRYGIRQGKPHLEVADTVPASIAFVDWRSRPAADQPAALQAAATAAAQTRFLLDQPPLFLLQCFRMEDEHHVLVLTMHHVVSDLLSLDLFFAELATHYGAILRGDTSPAAPPPWIYQDHAHQEQAERAGKQQSPSAQFWRDHLAHAPTLAWRSDFPRPARPTGQAATTHLTLDADTVQAVEALARQERVTPFVVLLGAYYVMQWAITGSDDQLVGVPWANRNRQEVQQLIGMFSSPCPMRVGLSSHTVFRDLLMQVRQTVLGITEHASLPLADVVEIAQAASDGKPLVMRSMFSYVSRMKALTFPGLQAERVPTSRAMSDLDLFLTVYVDGACWRGVFEYSTELFSPGMAASLAEAYGAIIRMVAAEPAKTVAELATLVPLPRELQIAVAATFTADPLEEVARFWGRELRWPVRMAFAPYNQVFQTLLDPAGELSRDGNSLDVLLIRPEDWVRYQEDPALRRDTMARTTGEFIQAARQAKLSAPLVIYLCPGSPDTQDGEAIATAERQIEDALTGAPGVTVVRAETALRPYAVTEIHDARSDGIGHIPFTRQWFSALGTEVVRRATSRQRTPLKVIALDCDNTLWRGTAGEDGHLGVKVEGPYRALQEFVSAQADAGVLLCLVSKNETEDVFRVFDHNPGFVLRRDQIAGHRINWLPKSGNLRALAAELNLGLDSFAFIDDNPVECAEVQAACPEVLTLCLPKDPDDIPGFLASVWAFDRAQVTDEDRKRGKQIQQNRKREELRQEAGSFEDFLARLELVVDATPADDKTMPRLAQLSQRTNQFNNAGVRYDEAQLRRQLAGQLASCARPRCPCAIGSATTAWSARCSTGSRRPPSRSMASCSAAGSSVAASSTACSRISAAPPRRTGFSACASRSRSSSATSRSCGSCPRSTARTPAITAPTRSRPTRPRSRASIPSATVIRRSPRPRRRPPRPRSRMSTSPARPPWPVWRAGCGAPRTSRTGSTARASASAARSARRRKAKSSARSQTSGSACSGSTRWAGTTTSSRSVATRCSWCRSTAGSSSTSARTSRSPRCSSSRRSPRWPATWGRARRPSKPARRPRRGEISRARRCKRGCVSSAACVGASAPRAAAQPGLGRSWMSQQAAPSGVPEESCHEQAGRYRDARRRDPAAGLEPRGVSHPRPQPRSRASQARIRAPPRRRVRR